MSTFTVEATIARPPEAVWSTLTNWSEAPRWMNGIDSMTAHGETTTGTRVTFHARGKDRDSEIAACEPGKRIVLRSVQRGVTADYVYTLVPEGDGTRAKLVATCTFTGAWKLLAPVIGFAIKKTDGGQIDALKALVEGT